MILPLTQKHDIKFRRAVWDEHIGVLRALSIPLGQVNNVRRMKDIRLKLDCSSLSLLFVLAEVFVGITKYT